METGDANFNDFKDFTATLILKMEHRRFLVFDNISI